MGGGRGRGNMGTIGIGGSQEGKGEPGVHWPPQKAS